MLSGTMSCGEPGQPAPARISRAMALTQWLMSAKCWFMASLLTGGMTRPVPRAGQFSTISDGAEPSAGHSNRLRLPEPLAGFAQLNRRSRRMRGRVPRAAQMPWLSAGGLRQGVQGAKRFGMVHGGFILKPDFDRPASSGGIAVRASPAKFFEKPAVPQDRFAGARDAPACG
jgi:hypothetical protein